MINPVQTILADGTPGYHKGKPYAKEVSGVSRRVGPLVANHLFEDIYDGEFSSDELIRRIHSMVTYDYESEELARVNERIKPGEYRDIQVRFGPFIPPQPEDVPPIMHAFTDKLDELINEIPDNIDARLYTHVLSAFAGVTLLSIHSFSDGNGRTSRALMDYIEYSVLRKAGYHNEEISVYQRDSIDKSGEEGYTDRKLNEQVLRTLQGLYYPGGNVFFHEYVGRNDFRYPSSYYNRLCSQGREGDYFDALKHKMTETIGNTTLDSLFDSPLGELSRKVTTHRESLYQIGDTVPVSVTSILSGLREREGRFNFPDE